MECAITLHNGDVMQVVLLVETDQLLVIQHLHGHAYDPMEDQMQVVVEQMLLVLQ